ncbi:DUF4279 domain-containing protein [Vitiosangium sp. GDMCC 1.1324]|uniref:DUF4279 domain-containing protein n=1 Tax=Vitiosangium sp. (strain GDMCC 1.1324) TaxID=2138576 RepID=UPI000D348552|nr:DUF4279 domain-containing protein [Vitiosangium sp. GDMCC 1.1324]PTL81083.1 hypothetical protein DAT35_23405 [Vitiosangium sp. GDMCC 1.1324]
MSTPEDSEPKVIAVVGGLVDESSACIALYGTDLDPSDITARLGCQPTSSHRRGERRSPRSKPYHTGAWLLEARGTAPTGPDALIRRLFMRLPLDAELWRSLSDKNELQVRIAVHMSGWNQGFNLSPEVVGLIHQIGAQVVFDIYAYDEQEE